MYALKGGSFGFQIGAEATDLILLVMNDRGMESILSSEVKLGTDASIRGEKIRVPATGRQFVDVLECAEQRIEGSRFDQVDGESACRDSAYPGKLAIPLKALLRVNCCTGVF